MRTPLAAGVDLSFASRLLQHALVFDDESSDSARKLGTSLSKATYVSSSSVQADRNAELAHHMMALFEANRFRGHMDGLARSHTLPLLTKLAGGYRAWQAPRKRLAREQAAQLA